MPEPQIEIKPWGHCERLFCDDLVELTRITVKAGGKSSRHHHCSKANLFWVESGSMYVTIFQAGVSPENFGKRVASVLWLSRDSEPLAISQMTVHQFEALTDCVCYELYQAEPGTKLDPNDIIRIEE